MSDNGNLAAGATQPSPTPQPTPQQATETTYTPLDVFVSEVKYQDGTQKEFEPMTINASDRHQPKFAMPNNVDVSIEGLTELYLSEKFVKSIVKHSNVYAKAKYQGNIKPVTQAEILIFFSIILYMGVVRLPAKADYFKTHGMWPVHKPCQQMSFYCFEQIWRVIHLTAEEERGDEPEGESEPGELREQDDDEDVEIPQVDTRWYAKAAPMIDMVNKISQKLCKWPGFCLSVDEMMKR